MPATTASHLVQVLTSTRTPTVFLYYYPFSFFLFILCYLLFLFSSPLLQVIPSVLFLFIFCFIICSVPHRQLLHGHCLVETARVYPDASEVQSAGRTDPNKPPPTAFPSAYTCQKPHPWICPLPACLLTTVGSSTAEQLTSPTPANPADTETGKKDPTLQRLMTIFALFGTTTTPLPG
jgi:hypothetical protein